MSVTSGSGSHGPTYVSRRTRAERSWSIASRVVTVARYAFGDSIARAVVGRALKPDERLLHDVLGLGDAAEHAVGDREHQRTQLA